MSRSHFGGGFFMPVVKLPAARMGRADLDFCHLFRSPLCRTLGVELGYMQQAPGLKPGRWRFLKGLQKGFL